jgi:hypothetical protein
MGTNCCFQYFDSLQHLKGNVVSTKSNSEIKTGMSNVDPASQLARKKKNIRPLSSLASPMSKLVHSILAAGKILQWPQCHIAAWEAILTSQCHLGIIKHDRSNVFKFWCEREALWMLQDHHLALASLHKGRLHSHCIMRMLSLHCQPNLSPTTLQLSTTETMSLPDTLHYDQCIPSHHITSASFRLGTITYYVFFDPSIVLTPENCSGQL